LKIIVNALCSTNLSGRAVLLGHLEHLASWTANDHQFIVLYHAGNRDIIRDFGHHVSWKKCPAHTATWYGRAFWERIFLADFLKKNGADLLFMLSGTAINASPVPQISLTLNPWCLVPEVHNGIGEKFKAFLQRKAYAHAVRNADMMAYCSDFMREIFRKNAGCTEKSHVMAYCGLNEDIFQCGNQVLPYNKRKKNRIVTVSLMAPHKGVETIIHALAMLKNEYQIEAEYALVGGWTTEAYRQSIENLIDTLGVRSQVVITGHVTRNELFGQYSQSMVFCLMSRCESFGIPSIEAQFFGTPVVSSNCCAIPGVCGAGGLFPAKDDTRSIAESLAIMLRDRDRWQTYSVKARANALKYRYDLVAKPLLKMFDL